MSIPPRKVVITGALTRDTVQALADVRGLHLELSHASGWNGEGLDLLPALSDAVEHLDIDHALALDVSMVNTLPRLRSLALHSAVKGTVALTSLEGLGLYTKAGRIRFSGQPQRLTRLAGTLDSATLEACASGGLLQTLILVKSRLEQLPDASLLSDLQQLQLFTASRLTSIDPALQSRSLQYLRANGCRELSVTAPVASPALKYFAVNDCSEIRSLDLLGITPSLQAVSLLGRTSVGDGRIAHVVRQGHVKDLRLLPKPGYDITADQLPSDPDLALRLAQEMEFAGVHAVG
ncbi:hypothetical protein [Stenotrophomonas sp.]|uniref:hypothetical protein n=1 Tax=Stenotrophomonas sp. TaxID=69392 RepID=UPI0028A976FE|nr:hypothetical protein [Stenotrophomonas sp.]